MACSSSDDELCCNDSKVSSYYFLGFSMSSFFIFDAVYLVVGIVFQPLKHNFFFFMRYYFSRHILVSKSFVL